MLGKLLSSRSSTLNFGLSCLIKFCSSSSASVSVRVVRNIIEAVSEIIRVIRRECCAEGRE